MRLAPRASVSYHRDMVTGSVSRWVLIVVVVLIIVGTMMAASSSNDSDRIGDIGTEPGALDYLAGGG